MADTTGGGDDIGGKMAKGAAWMVFFKLAERSIGLLSTIILARLLVPADFGLVAMATSIIAALELLSAFSFDVQLIQNQQAERRHYDTAWTFNVIFGMTSALILVLLAWPAARFYDEARLESVMYVLAIGYLAQSFENIGTVAFRKELQFSRDFSFLIAKRLVAFCVTVALAFYWRNYWALVYGTVAAKFAGALFSYALHPYRPRPSLEAARELFHFSKWLLVNNVLFFLDHRSADFVIGKLIGPHALGIYTIAYEIASLPTTELGAPINRAVMPGYARIAANRETLRWRFLQVTSIIALIVFPAGAGIAVCAELVTSLFLGEKWLDAVPLIEILAIYGTVMAAQTNFGALLYALGRPKTVFLLWLLHVAILVPALAFFTVQKGLMGAAWACLGTALALLPLNCYVIGTVLAIGPGSMWAVVWRPLVSTALMVWTVQSILELHYGAPTLQGSVVQLMLAVTTGVITYSLFTFFLWQLAGRPKGAEQVLWSRIANIIESKTHGELP